MAVVFISIVKKTQRKHHYYHSLARGKCREEESIKSAFIVDSNRKIRNRWGNMQPARLFFSSSFLLCWRWSFVFQTFYFIHFFRLSCCRCSCFFRFYDYLMIKYKNEGCVYLWLSWLCLPGPWTFPSLTRIAAVRQRARNGPIPRGSASLRVARTGSVRVRHRTCVPSKIWRLSPTTAVPSPVADGHGWRPRWTPWPPAIR